MAAAAKKTGNPAGIPTEGRGARVAGCCGGCRFIQGERPPVLLLARRMAGATARLFLMAPTCVEAMARRGLRARAGGCKNELTHPCLRFPQNQKQNTTLIGSGVRQEAGAALRSSTPLLGGVGGAIALPVGLGHRSDLPKENPRMKALKQTRGGVFVRDEALPSLTGQPRLLSCSLRRSRGCRTTRPHQMAAAKWFG